MAARSIAPTAPELVLETESGSTVMSPGHEYHVARDPLSGIVLDDDRASWHHAVLRAHTDHWTLEDENSTNGTFADGHRVHEWEVGPGSVIRFGSLDDGPRAVLTGLAPERPSGIFHPASTGTFLNGRPVDQARIAPGDIVGIGHSAFCLVGDELQEYVDTGEVSLDVQELGVAVDHGRKTLLDKVAFPVGEKCLLAVVGPSGAGKSTLLNALTGRRLADSGTVLYDRAAGTGRRSRCGCTTRRTSGGCTAAGHG